MIKKVTAVILAGGRSRRMGEDKAFLPFPDTPLIGVVFGRLSGLFEKIMIIANDTRRYEKYPCEVIKDIIPGKGPLGGLYTALSFSGTGYSFVTACDMPFLNRELIKHIVGSAGGYDVVIPEFNGRLRPLCAVYSKNCLKIVEKSISGDDFRITGLLPFLKVRAVKEKESVVFDKKGRSFININTENDYKGYLEAGWR